MSRILELRPLDRVGCIVIVGPTCAGKSTILDAFRKLSPPVEVPRRFLTRAVRAGDRESESEHVEAKTFEKKVRTGEIGFHWVRPMEKGREERYGFPPPNAGRFAVYSANNAIYANAASVRPPSILGHAFLLGVDAPYAAREARFRVRSPDLWETRQDEVRHRLEDRSEEMREHVHAVIDNGGGLEETVRDALEFLRRLIERASI